MISEYLAAGDISVMYDSNEGLYYLRVIGEVSTECTAEVGRLASEAAREQEAKVTLQEAWKEVQDKYNQSE